MKVDKVKGAKWLQRQESNLRSSGHEPDGDAAPLLCHKPLSGFGVVCEKS